MSLVFDVVAADSLGKGGFHCLSSKRVDKAVAGCI